MRLGHAMRRAAAGRRGAWQYPRDGLLAEWLFNGNALDTSGNGYDGTVYGATLTNDQKGVANQAYEFVGGTDNINCGNVSSGLGGGSSFTILQWFKALPTSVQEALIAKNNYDIAGYCILIQPTGNIRFGISSNVDSVSTVDDGVWHLLVCEYEYVDSSTAIKRIYLDNNLDNSGTITPINATNSYDTLIGMRKSSSGAIRNSFIGTISDTVIYNRLLTSAEKTDIYNHTKP
jgi:hypothetical protein